MPTPPITRLFVRGGRNACCSLERRVYFGGIPLGKLACLIEQRSRRLRWQASFGYWTRKCVKGLAADGKAPRNNMSAIEKQTMLSTNIYISPTGKQIVGTAEKVLATAWISGIDPDTQEPEYEGGTKIYWDTQETLERDGKTIFVCEDGEHWTFDQLVPVPEHQLGG